MGKPDRHSMQSLMGDTKASWTSGLDGGLIAVDPEMLQESLKFRRFERIVSHPEEMGITKTIRTAKILNRPVRDVPHSPGNRALEPFSGADGKGRTYLCMGPQIVYMPVQAFAEPSMSRYPLRQAVHGRTDIEIETFRKDHGSQFAHVNTGIRG